MESLVDYAHQLASTLQNLQQVKDRSEPDVPYRQLVPVRVWRKVIEEQLRLDHLAEELPSFIDDALAGQAPRARLLSIASELESAASLFREQSAEALDALAF